MARLPGRPNTVPGSIGREVITLTFGSRERITTLQEVTVRSFKWIVVGIILHYNAPGRWGFIRASDEAQFGVLI